MGRIALIDGDIIAYRCAASCEPTKTNPEAENERIAIARANELMDRILNSTQTSEYRVFISGTDNFRKLIYPEYKRNRDEIPKPRHLDALRNLLVGEWGGEVAAGYEADDGIGIAAREDFVICSIDKDFRQIPGRHYNFVKEQHEVVSDEEATFAFWAHMLIGDTSDNVRGVRGIGPVKAGRALQGLSADEMEAVVYDFYGDPGRFALNRCLLRILRAEEEYTELEAQIREGQGPWLAAEGP